MFKNKVIFLTRILLPFLGFMLINKTIHDLVRTLTHIAVEVKYFQSASFLGHIWSAVLMTAAALFFLLLPKQLNVKTYKILYLISGLWPLLKFLSAMSQLSSPLITKKDAVYYSIFIGEILTVVIVLLLLYHIGKLPKKLSYLRKKICNS